MRKYNIPANETYFQVAHCVTVFVIQFVVGRNVEYEDRQQACHAHLSENKTNKYNENKIYILN